LRRSSKWRAIGTPEERIGLFGKLNSTPLLLSAERQRGSEECVLSEIHHVGPQAFMTAGHGILQYRIRLRLLRDGAGRSRRLAGQPEGQYAISRMFQKVLHRMMA
jgi:hypothetical protein